MAAQTWSIMIVPAPSGGGVVFTPDVFGANPGDSLKAQNSDLVSWNNQTNDEHQLSRSDTQASLCDPIAGWESSTPAYLITDTAPATIKYFCLKHPNEQGVIDVIA